MANAVADNAYIETNFGDELSNDLKNAIQAKNGRPDVASECQNSNNLLASQLRLTIRQQPNSTSADVGILVLDGNNDDDVWKWENADVVRLDVELPLLKRLIQRIDGAIMDRVFEVVLRLQGPRPAGEDLALLPTIHRRINHEWKLHLALKGTSITALTSNAPKETFTMELPGVKLQNLKLKYVSATRSDNMNAVFNYVSANEFPETDEVAIRLERCGHASFDIGNVANRFEQLTSLHLDFTDHPGPATYFPSDANWAALSDLKKLRNLEVIGDASGGNLETLPRIDLPFLENLVLENVMLSVHFFSAIPQLAVLKIQHDIDARARAFYNQHLREFRHALADGELKALTTLHICAPDIESLGGKQTLQPIITTIVNNYAPHCPMLQTLILDFDLRANNGENIWQLLNSKEFKHQQLSKAPLTIEIPTAALVPLQNNNWLPVNRKQIREAIEKLSRAVFRSGLQRLKLDWNTSVSRRDVLAVMENFSSRHLQQQSTIRDGLKIEWQASDYPKAPHGHVATAHHIIWKNLKAPPPHPNPFQAEDRGTMQRVELTHRGPAVPRPPRLPIRYLCQV